MEIRVLRYFLAVAREQSISGAAQALHLSQPTLSRQLMDMEQKFGKQLFIRGNKRITLTEDGMLFRRRAEEIIDLVDKTEAEITATDDSISGDIYIGAGETEVMRHLAKIAKDIQNDYPDIHYHIFSGNAEIVMERLDKGLIDFGLLLDANDASKYNYVELPSTDIFGILMKKDSPFADREAISFNDLKKMPLIVSAQPHYHAPEKQVKKILDSLNIVATYNLIYNASLLVEEGLGYALCLDRLIKITDESPLCFVPLESQYEIKPYVAWKKNQVFSKASDLFLKRLCEAFGNNQKA
ncbi:MAG: LysR family transcriptional regulator [Oscillospiraceae bacterium]|nr:LysR family transcriptional regulator [Oscillospiraceae bacterium]